MLLISYYEVDTSEGEIDISNPGQAWHIGLVVGRRINLATGGLKMSSHNMGSWMIVGVCIYLVNSPMPGGV